MIEQKSAMGKTDNAGKLATSTSILTPSEKHSSFFSDGISHKFISQNVDQMEIRSSLRTSMFQNKQINLRTAYFHRTNSCRLLTVKAI